MPRWGSLIGLPPAAGDLSELAMHQPPVRVADPENGPGMPCMEDPILGSFDTPTDVAMEPPSDVAEDDAPDEDEGGTGLWGSASCKWS